MTIIDQIRIAQLSGKSDESAFSSIPQHPVYMEIQTVDSTIIDKHLTGYRLVEPLLEVFGLKVYESSLCGKSIPVREHKQRMCKANGDHWIAKGATYPERGNYHARIQKKWNKRYGFTLTPNVIITGNGSIALVSAISALELMDEYHNAYFYDYRLD